MVNPIRPNEASSIYRRLVGATAESTGGSGRTQDAGGAGNRRQDQVHISEQAQTRLRLLEAVRSEPAARADLVARLKEQISSGDYEIDGDAIAEAMLDEGLR